MSDNDLIWDNQYGLRTRGWLKNKKKGGKRILIEEKKEKEVIEDTSEWRGESEWKTPTSYDDYTRRYGVDYSKISFMDSYDYGFGKSAKGTGDIWGEFSRTGTWRGYDYYRPSSVDYGYIEKMANAFSAQHNIKIVSSNLWAIDLEKKELMYNPRTLMFGTKAEVVAILLHEIGHLRYTSPRKDLKFGKIGKKYEESAFEEVNVFEDFRIDKRMRKAYAGSEEVYKAMDKTVKEIAENYKAKAELEQRAKIKIASDINHAIALIKANGFSTLALTAMDYHIPKSLLEKLLEAKNLDEEIEKIVGRKDLSLHDYNTAIILTAYGEKITSFNPLIQEMVHKTEGAIKKAETAESTQALLDMLETDVFPTIQELLKNYQKEQEAITSLHEFSNMRGNRKQKGKTETIKSGRGSNSDYPTEWYRGDYKALKESVSTPIRELIRKLRFIRIKDLTKQWISRLRSGKVNVKSVYRFASGEDKIFRKQREVMDRTRNFAFSIVIDVSGSMDGEKSIEATRGAIILSEVFSFLKIPFEVMTFGSFARILKEFEEEYTKDKKTLVGGMTKANQNDTRLDLVFGKTKLPKRSENNKYMIVLTDGDTAFVPDCKQGIKDFEKQGIKGIGISVGNENYLADIIRGSQLIEDANSVPEVFSDILRKIIKKM